MDNIRYIDSLKNQQLKEVVLLKEKSRWRKKNGQFVAEGRKEVEMALKGGYEILKIFFNSEIISVDALTQMLHKYSVSPEIIEVSREVYKRMAYREKTEGIVALGISKNHELSTLSFERNNPLVLVAEGLEKPGNVGALLRTADAAALDAVIIADPKVDLYNPNIIRSSLGCLFTLPIYQAATSEVLDFLTANKINSIAAELNATMKYTDINFTEPTAIVVGAESTGLSEQWINSATHNIIIPMGGEIDSMNVSVSAAILIFEAKRQRGF